MRFSARTLEYVETYLNSPYSLDAWILLSMVASNIKSKTPQFVYFKLQDNLCDFVSKPNRCERKKNLLTCCFVSSTGQRSTNESILPAGRRSKMVRRFSSYQSERSLLEIHNAVGNRQSVAVACETHLRNVLQICTANG